MKKTVLFLSALILTSCLKEDDLKVGFVSYTPDYISDGWEISDPGSENIDPDSLRMIFADFHNDMSIWQARSLTVIRNGKLVAESYTKDEADRLTPRAIWSCTKQVIGLLAGIAVDKGVIKDINDPLAEYLPETSQYQGKHSITVEHLLTMRSGINYSNDGIQGQTDDICRQLPDNLNKFILGLPLKSTPGEKAVYKDCDPQLIASLLQSELGIKTSEWAWNVLLRKLEIKNFDWVEYKDGTTLGGFGIMTTPRELAKFGQLVLDSGVYKGNRVVSSKWIKEMTSSKVDDIYGYQFGYLWWKDTKRNMNFMSGHGGQYVCIVPDRKLVVVMTAEVNTQGDFQFGKKAFEWVDKIMEITD